MPYLVSLAAQTASTERASLLSEIAGIEAMRTLGNVYDPHRQITPDLVTAYEQSLRDLVPLVQETLAAGPKWEGGTTEVNTASLISLLAFAHGEGRLGYLLSRWLPYAQSSTGQEFIPTADLRFYEEMTGDIRNPLTGQNLRTDLFSDQSGPS
ncbi:hypothetical protein [Deinococcus sp. 23YEL01]|uniref:hypothetical protein n=1 Tax=Deinococcus sp. 23YEL01 TaxID=2745871 RepID=UPI001E4474D4|nr:hypothetical protein [Deinococcus sp. 23YEL01]MCD0171824.1 hypothetical protein [Deinococcus sp. 23YEL01]